MLKTFPPNMNAMSKMYDFVSCQKYNMWWFIKSIKVHLLTFIFFLKKMMFYHNI